MTRDEAIKALVATLPKMSESYYGQLADSFVVLGMLKLDEPPTLDQRVNLAINSEIFTHRSVLTASHIKSALNVAGLKIVEK